MMALQFAGQSTNTALGRARQAVFFSLLRKAVIVIPLTLWLPGRFGLGVNGVFLAEPISNFLGGGACFVTMLLTVWPDLKRRERLHASGAPRLTDMRISSRHPWRILPGIRSFNFFKKRLTVHPSYVIIASVS